MDRILRLEVRLDNLTEQVKVDHQHLLLGLETQCQSLITKITQGFKEQKNLLTEHFTKSESRFDELAGIVKELTRSTSDEITDIKQRLDKLENPAA